MWYADISIKSEQLHLREEWLKATENNLRIYTSIGTQSNSTFLFCASRFIKWH